MARGDAFDFQVFGRVAGQFEDFGREVFEDGGYVDGGCCFFKKKGEVSFGGIEGTGRDKLLRVERKELMILEAGLKTYLWHRRASCFACCS